MSKYVKQLITDHLRNRLQGVDDLLVVNVIGMTANATTSLRRRLRAKGIQLMVVKNSLARRATEGTALAPAFEGGDGSAAIIWGGEDLISLAKEVTQITRANEFAGFAPRGGVMDAAPLSANDIERVSKWPSRQEQLSLLLGQILSPGRRLASQIIGPGGRLASQIEKLATPEPEQAAQEQAAQEEAAP
jgi:large subunit ribosomal protein L10